jgi:hypothetical protein
MHTTCGCKSSMFLERTHSFVLHLALTSKSECPMCVCVCCVFVCLHACVRARACLVSNSWIVQSGFQVYSQIYGTSTQGRAAGGLLSADRCHLVRTGISGLRWLVPMRDK